MSLNNLDPNLGSLTLDTFRESTTVKKYYASLKYLLMSVSLLVVILIYYQYTQSGAFDASTFNFCLGGLIISTFIGAFYSALFCLSAIHHLGKTALTEDGTFRKVLRHFPSIFTLTLAGHVLNKCFKFIRRFTDDGDTGLSDVGVPLTWDFIVTLCLPLILERDMSLTKSLFESAKRLDTTTIPIIRGRLQLMTEALTPGESTRALIYIWAAGIAIGPLLLVLEMVPVIYLGFLAIALLAVSVATYIAYISATNGIFSACLYCLVYSSDEALNSTGANPKKLYPLTSDPVCGTYYFCLRFIMTLSKVSKMEFCWSLLAGNAATIISQST